MSGSRRTLAAVIAAAVSGWSCSSAAAPNPPPKVAAVIVSPTTSTLAPNAQLPLRAEVHDGSGELLPDAAVTWTVQDPAIVSISDAGVVTALSVGTSQVAASSLGKSGIAIVTVKAESVNPGTTTPGTSTPGTENPGAENPGTTNPGTDTPATGNPGTENPGTGNPGTENPGTDTPKTEPPAEVATVAVTAPPPRKVKRGETIQLVANATDTKGNAMPNQSFVWSSSNTNTATVSATGLVTGKNKGDVTITARISGGTKSGSADIEVK